MVVNLSRRTSDWGRWWESWETRYGWRRGRSGSWRRSREQHWALDRDGVD